MSRLESVTRAPTAADVLAPLLRRQVAEFRAREADVRSEQLDAVHRYRVAARRLRSNVAAFSSLLDPAACKILEQDLRETATILGGPRDAEVIQRRIDSLLKREPPSLEVDQVKRQLAERLETSRHEGRRRSLSYLDSAKYDSLTRNLDRFADLPPWSPAAAVAADQAFAPVMQKEWTTFLKRGRRALSDDAGAERDEHLHDVRKAAKRVRYVAEAETPVFGRKAERLRRAAERVQVVLGELHDSALTRSLLDAAVAGSPSQVHDVLGRLQSREIATAGELYDAFVPLFRDADRKRLRKWMSSPRPRDG